jgi:hypothetical protein
MPDEGFVIAGVRELMPLKCVNWVVLVIEYWEGARKRKRAYLQLLGRRGVVIVYEEGTEDRNENACGAEEFIVECLYGRIW